MPSKFINNTSKFITMKKRNLQWIETPWEFVFNTGMASDIYIHDSVSFHNKLHMIGNWNGTVKYWDGSIVNNVETGFVNLGLCIEGFPNVIHYSSGLDSILYGGALSASNPVRRSYDEGLTYATTLTMSDDYCYDMKEHQSGGVWYMYLSTGNNGVDWKLRRRSGLNGSSWTNVVDLPQDYRGKLEVFDDELYIGSYTGELFKYDEGSNLISIGQPVSSQITCLYNYKDEKLFIGYITGELYIYDKINMTYIYTLGYIPQSIQFYKTKLFVFSKENATEYGRVYYFNPHTLNLISYDDLGSNLISSIIFNDEIYTFPKIGSNLEAWKKRIYLG